MRPNCVVDKLCCQGFETALNKNISYVLETFYSEILFNARTFWRANYLWKIVVAPAYSVFLAYVCVT